jgi:hypothetical protein
LYKAVTQYAPDTSGIILGVEASKWDIDDKAMKRGREDCEQILNCLCGVEVVDCVVGERGEVEGGFVLDGGWL